MLNPYNQNENLWRVARDLLFRARDSRLQADTLPDAAVKYQLRGYANGLRAAATIMLVWLRAEAR